MKSTTKQRAKLRREKEIALRDAHRNIVQGFAQRQLKQQLIVMEAVTLEMERTLLFGPKRTP